MNNIRMFLKNIIISNEILKNNIKFFKIHTTPWNKKCKKWRIGKIFIFNIKLWIKNWITLIRKLKYYWLKNKWSLIGIKLNFKLIEWINLILKKQRKLIRIFIEKKRRWNNSFKSINFRKRKKLYWKRKVNFIK
jgi:hypothetical protein